MWTTSVFGEVDACGKLRFAGRSDSGRWWGCEREWTAGPVVAGGRHKRMPTGIRLWETMVWQEYCRLIPRMRVVEKTSRSLAARKVSPGKPCTRRLGKRVRKEVVIAR
ncbi:hypothetical protein GCM10017788_52470 [Amycolatopsis acidiphila]|nr:hypothetical protein GCM10017788_52470 [Amycolatopsis acidiphila]